MICRTDVDISSEQYDSHAAAVKAARKARDRSDWFCDYEHPDEDDLPPYVIRQKWKIGITTRRYLSVS